MQTARRLGVALAVTGCALAGGAAWGLYRPHLLTASADADDPALVTRGRHIYAAQCAACHGRVLQGQPLWQVQDEFAHRRAPALDRFGPAWQRSDETLLRIVATGSSAAMPEFAGRLDTRGIFAVTAFIKSRWPVGLRVAQALLNPAGRGTPRVAAASAWRFPPNCTPPAR